MARAQPDVASLALFFTRGVSLGTWDDRGILDRELALYRSLASRLGPVSLVTYGTSADLTYSDRVAPARVLPNRARLPLPVYGRLLPLLHRRALAGATVFKTNQVYGGTAAVRAARLYRKPLIARAGFLWSEVVESEHGASSARARFAANRERALFRAAGLSVVTTARLKEVVEQRYGVDSERVVVIPNYVDTDRFRPGVVRPVPGRLIFIGRLSSEKNLGALVTAMSGLDGMSLAIVGDGPLRPELEKQAASERSPVEFLGRVMHDELPDVLGQAEALVLPSLYEGQPKAAIEAMACGLPVVGTDVPGVRDLVVDGKTGVLCGTQPRELRAGIERLMAEPDVRERLGQAAREAADEFSLERVVELELDAIALARRLHASS